MKTKSIILFTYILLLLPEDDTMIFGSSIANKPSQPIATGPVGPSSFAGPKNKPATPAKQVSLDEIVATLSTNDDERNMMKSQIEDQFRKSRLLPVKKKQINPFKVTLVTQSGTINFTIKTTGTEASDANCLFFAAAWQLYFRNVTPAYESIFIRGATVTHISDHLQLFHQLIEERIEDRSVTVEYFVLHILSLPTTYGGRESLIAISAHFESNILVFSKNKLEFIPPFNTLYTRTACFVNRTPERVSDIHFDGALGILGLVF